MLLLPPSCAAATARWSRSEAAGGGDRGGDGAYERADGLTGDGYEKWKFMLESDRSARSVDESWAGGWWAVAEPASERGEA